MALDDRKAATVDRPVPAGVEPERLLAAQEAAARFYQGQLNTEDGARPARFLAHIGVPVNGPWVVGFAPDRRTAVVNELRRRGFSDVEIIASGFADTGHRRQLVDRFQNRVMVGIRDGPGRDAPVVGFVGYAPPKAGPDVPARLYSEDNAIYRPESTLFGVGEQEDRAGRRPIVAAHPLDAIVVSARTANAASPPLAVAPAGQHLTERHVEVLGQVADLSAEVGVTLRTDPEGLLAGEQAYQMLAPTVGARHVVVASWATGLDDTRLLTEVLAAGRVDRAAGFHTTGAEREAAARPTVAPERSVPEPKPPAPAPKPPASEREPPATEPQFPAPRPGSSAGPLAPPPPAGERAPRSKLSVRQPSAGRSAPDSERQPSAEAQPGGDPSVSLEQHRGADRAVAAVQRPAPAADPPNSKAGDPAPALSRSWPRDQQTSEAQAPVAGSVVAESPAAPKREPATGEPGAGQEPPAAAAESSGLALPPRARPVDGVAGYHYVHAGQQITVFGPDNAPVATAKPVGDGTIWAGEVDGVRIPSFGNLTNRFKVVAARQHRAARLPADQRDRVWIELVPDIDAVAGYVVEVHGTIEGDRGDGLATNVAAVLLSSDKGGPRATGRGWAQVKVDTNLSRLLTEFAQQDRDVLVSQAGVGRDVASASAAASVARQQPREEHPESTSTFRQQLVSDSKALPGVKDSAPPENHAASRVQTRATAARFTDRADPGARADPAAAQVPVAESGPEPVETSGHALPDHAKPVEGVAGYHYTDRGTRSTVYGPDNTPIATADSIGNFMMAGEVNGVRIAAFDNGDFELIAANQHRAANLPADQRDQVWVEIEPDSAARAGYVVVVRGTEKGNALDHAAAKGAAHFYWSPARNAHASGRAWKRATVEENLGRLLGEFVKQGRNVVVSPAGPERNQAPDQHQPREEAVVAPDPQSLSDEELMTAFLEEARRVGHGRRRDEAAAARTAALKTEQRDRVRRRIADAPDVSGMSYDELAAEATWLDGGFARTAFDVQSEDELLRKARREAVEGELRGPAHEAPGEMYEQTSLVLDSSPSLPVSRDSALPEKPATQGIEAAPAVGDFPDSGAAEFPAPVQLQRFRPTGQRDLAPFGEGARVVANLDALRALKRQIDEGRAATPEEQKLYARWSGWAATPALFDERPGTGERFAAQRAKLRELVDDAEYRAARRTSHDVHFTEASYVQSIWDALGRLGFSGGNFLVPGCGSGNFIGFAPEGAHAVGVELDPTTASIAQALYPDAQIRAESFAETRAARDVFDLVVGNVPFGDYSLRDPDHNPDRRHVIHNHFILKSLRLTRPGGVVALITSRDSMDGQDEAHQAARAEMAELADLLGAVRLPVDNLNPVAGARVVTDLVVLRRREGGPARHAGAWQGLRASEFPGARDGVPASTFKVNEYFLEHPEMVLGHTLTDTDRHGPRMTVRAAGPTETALGDALDRIVAHARETGLTTAQPTSRAEPQRAARRTGRTSELVTRDRRDRQVPQPAAGPEETGHALPEDAEPIDGVNGYHHTFHEGRTTVYGPDNAPVAAGEYVGNGMTAGEVDGVRLAAYGYGTTDFPQLVARQHRATRLPVEELDRVSVEIVPDSDARAGYVVVVHGTIKDDRRDDRAAKDEAHFLWSGKREARVSGRSWTATKVEENLGRLLKEFARQGRNVLVSRADVGLDKVSALDPRSLTDDELLGELRTMGERLGEATGSAHDAAAARAAALSEERQDRVLRRINDAPAVTDMTDEELAAEERWLQRDFTSTAFPSRSESDRLVKARREIVQGETRGREVRALLAGSAPEELSDQALADTDHPDHEALERQRDALRDEMAARPIGRYQQRADVAGLTVEELTAESAELVRASEHLALAGREDVDTARQTRLEAVEAAIDRRPEARSPELPTRDRDTGPFTAMEAARIRIAVEDHAAQYYGGPFKFGPKDAARYVSEGHLGELVDKHGLKKVWNAVAAHIDAHPELLTRSEAERRAARDARRERARVIQREARAALDGGDLDRAGKLIDSGEFIDPYHGDYGDTWQRGRRAIENQRTKRREAGSVARDAPKTGIADAQRGDRAPTDRGMAAPVDSPGLDPM